MARKLNLQQMQDDSFEKKPGDEFQGYTYNGTTWDKGPAKPSQTADTTYNATMQTVSPLLSAVTPDTLLHGKKDKSELQSTQEALADKSTEMAGRMQADAQRGYQLASRDPRVEASKTAAADAAAQFQQGMEQTSGEAGGGAAVLANRKTVSPAQYEAQHRERADQQQREARAVKTQAEGQEKAAIEERGFGAELAREEQERAARDRAVRALAQGGTETATDNEKKEDVKTEETPPVETPPVENTRNLENIKAQNLPPAVLTALGTTPKEVDIAELTRLNAMPGWEGKMKFSVKADRWWPGAEGEFKPAGHGETTTVPVDSGYDTRIKNIISAVHRRF